MRRSGLATESKVSYDEKFQGLTHLYYSKEWVLEQLNNLGCRAEVIECLIPDWGYRNYRFSVQFERIR